VVAVNAPVWLLAGAGFGLGLVLIADGSRRRPAGEATAEPSRLWWRLRQAPAQAPMLAAAVAAGLVVAVLTGWPAAGALAGLAVVALPGLLGPDRDHQRALARVEALAGWTELLRDTLRAGAGLQQAIIATAPNADAAIRAQLLRLAGRLHAGGRPPAALRGFADQLADPLADMVVAALLLAAGRPSANLAGLLGELAGTAREQAAMRQRVATSRARLRTSARSITAITVVMLLGLVVLNREWMAPYDSPVGQVVMLAAGSMFAGGLVGLRRMSLLPTGPRLLGNPPGGGGRR
jgi:Flp pilus assembly protein TadB